MMGHTKKRQLARLLALASLVTTLGRCQILDGYEIGTHALVTRQAYFSFVQDNPTKLDALGVLRFFPDAPTSIFGETYFDISSFTFRRMHGSLEDGIINRLATNPLSLEGWLMRGAIREDDILPSDDPFGPRVRVLNHFYDPYLDRPLTVGVALGARAPDWATGAVNAFTQPNTPSTSRENHFTIFDVQEAMFRALTLKARNSLGTFDDLTAAGDAAARQAIRQGYWATTFRALGDVLHLNQDMAQPQHTRNDKHSGFLLIGGGHTSVFEKYIEARALNERMFVVGLLFQNQITITPEITPTPLKLCSGSPCATYPLRPLFTQYSDFWSTTPGALGGIGLADYSNSGFFSAGKNLGQNEYNLPPNDPGAYSIVYRTAVDWAGQPITAQILALNGSVPDYMNPAQTATSVPLTTFSIFDEFMVARSANPSYHLIRENYDAQADLLLPRAVSYSAGLLGYVFRGSMEISAPSEGVYGIVDHSTFSGTNAALGSKGFSKLRAKVKNTSPAPPSGSGPESMDGGTLFGVLRFHRNTCYTDDLLHEPGVPGIDDFACRSGVEDIVVSDPKPSVSLTASEQEFTFEFNNGELPINATDVTLQVVYRGPLGNENDAVVVASKDLSEPTLVTLHNAFDYLGVGTDLHTRAEVNASPSLLDQVVPQTCVDRNQSPPRLQDTCFLEAHVTLTLVYGSGSPTTVRAVGLPVRRFARLALLVDATGDFTATLTNSLVPGQGSFTSSPLVWQYTFVPPSTIDESIAHVSAIRGIYGYDSLVEFWDAGFIEGKPTDELVAPLTPLSTQEAVPFPVDITPAPQTP